MSEKVTPLVSVAMITYGHEKYIAQAIEGVLAQKTNFPFELVIGTDCSPDNTDKIVAQYAAKYPDIIHVVSSEKNVGAMANSKRTNYACRGKYIAFCEGDDHWHDPSKLQMQVDVMEKDPQVGMVHTDIDSYEVMRNRRLKNINRIYGFLRKNIGSPRILDILTGAYNITTCTVCARRELIIKAIADNRELFDPKYKMADVQQWALLVRMCKFAYIDRSTVTYNILQESASHSADARKKMAFSDNAASVLLHVAQVLDLSDDEVKKLIEFNARVMLIAAAHCDDFECADRYWKLLHAKGCHVDIMQLSAYYAFRGRMFKAFFRLCFLSEKFMRVILREMRTLFSC